MPPQTLTGATQEQLRQELTRFIAILSELGCSREEAIEIFAVAYGVFITYTDIPRG
jgi:hypothetical protein